MRIVRCHNDIYKVVNDFEQKMGIFGSYDEAFDFIRQFECDDL